MRNGLFFPSPIRLSRSTQVWFGVETCLKEVLSGLGDELWKLSATEHDLSGRGDNFDWGPRKFCVRLAALRILLRTQHHVECNLHHTYIFSFVSTSFCTS